MVATSKANNIAKLEAEELPKSESLTSKALRRLRKDRITLLALGIFFLLAILSYSAPLIESAMGISYSRTNTAEKFASVCMPVFGIGGECNASHILGTDDIGRDIFVRLLYAGQVSLGIALAAAVISILIGVSLGMITGYFGGIVDDFINWFITTLTSIPSLFLLLIVSAIILSNPDLRQGFAGGPFALVLILGFLGWTGTTRLVRGETLSIRERDYILSARALGASPWRIMYFHILPNLLSIVTITLALDIGGLILTEAALSFLGLGVKEPVPTWGNMLNGAQSFYKTYPYLGIVPGLFIFITVLCLYVVGDGLRDAFDPTARD